MYEHHQESIRLITDKLRQNEQVQGLIVGGSIAHGFAKPNSDVDIMIVTSEEKYRELLQASQLQYFDRDSVTYEGGYVDGKWTCVDFIRQVAERGSEPARFAFQDAFVTYSRGDGLEALLKQASRYPVENKWPNIHRFYAQFEAWKWYSYEAIKHENQYLLNHSLSNFLLFGGRMILAHAETLYPYHKWFTRVLAGVQSKPAGFMDAFDQVLAVRNGDALERYYHLVMSFADWRTQESTRWPNRFMQDSELPWVSGQSAVADL